MELDDVKFTKFVRKPFEIEAVEITSDNIEQIAPMVGRLDKDQKTNTPFIEVNKELVPNMTRVWPGYWLTKMGDNIRCYASRVFADQFMEKPEANDNCEFFAKVDFGHGPVEIRCTETGVHSDHWCEVAMIQNGPEVTISRRGAPKE